MPLVLHGLLRPWTSACLPAVLHTYSGQQLRCLACLCSESCSGSALVQAAAAGSAALVCSIFSAALVPMLPMRRPLKRQWCLQAGAAALGSRQRLLLAAPVPRGQRLCGRPPRPPAFGAQASTHGRAQPHVCPLQVCLHAAAACLCRVLHLCYLKATLPTSSSTSCWQAGLHGCAQPHVCPLQVCSGAAAIEGLGSPLVVWGA